MEQNGARLDPYADDIITVKREVDLDKSKPLR